MIETATQTTRLAIEGGPKTVTLPPGATIYLGSKQCPAIGTTPWNGTLNKGEFAVIIEMQGFEPAQRSLKVAAVRTAQELFVPLVRRPQIEVRSDADPNLIGAAVSVDGQPSGIVQGPLVIQTTPARHLIEITKAGYQPLSQWVDLTSTPALVRTCSRVCSASCSGAGWACPSSSRPTLER